MTTRSFTKMMIGFVVVFVGFFTNIIVLVAGLVIILSVIFKPEVKTILLALKKQPRRKINF